MPLDRLPLTGPGRRAANARRLLRRGLAFLALAAAAWALSAASTRSAQTTDVVVAADDVPAGATLTGADVRVVPRPVAHVPADAARAPAELVGRPVTGAISRGEVLVPARVVGAGALDRLPAGRRAVSVPVADPAGARAVVAGNRVDLYRPGRSEPVLRGALVLSVPLPAANAVGPDHLQVAAPTTEVGRLTAEDGSGTVAGYVVALAATR